MRKPIKILVLGTIAVFAAWMLAGVFFDAKTDEPPAVKAAPYMLMTESRIYYLKEYKENEEQVIITGYYDLYHGKWKYNKASLMFERIAYLNLVVKKRKEG